MPSLTWHIVKKDFRYLWPWLSMWWGILVVSALDIVVSVQLIFHPVSEKIRHTVADNFTTGYWFFLAVDVLMLAMVVDGILKSDSPIDEKAFWRTRPMGKARMFSAKLVSIFLFCFMVPGVIQVVTHLIFGFSASSFLSGLEFFALMQGMLVALVACAALLFQRTVQGVISLIALFFLGVMGVEIYSAIYRGAENPYVASLLRAVLLGWWANFQYLPFIAVLVMAALVYAGRGRRIGLLALICGLLITSVTGFYFPDENDRPSIPAEQWLGQNSPRNDTVKLSVEPSQATRLQFTPLWSVHGWINNPGFPELKDSVWRIVNTSSELTWAGTKAPVITAPTLDSWGTGAAQIINAPAAIAAAGYGRLAWSTVGSWRNFRLATLDDAQLARIKKDPAQLSVKVFIQSGHLEKIADVAAADGAGWHDGMTKSQVHLLTLDDRNEVTIILDAVSPSYPWGDPVTLNVARIFLLYNPKAKECVEGVCTVAYPSDNPAFTWHQATMTFSFAHKIDGQGQPLADPLNGPALRAWLADAHLVELAFVGDQNFYLPVTFDQFLLPQTEPADAALKN